MQEVMQKGREVREGDGGRWKGREVEEIGGEGGNVGGWEGEGG